jgi:segregation and condensation protein B
VSSLNPLSQLVEAALFAANRPLTLDELEGLDTGASGAEVRAAVEELREHYDFDGHAVEIAELAGGYQILTRASFAAAVERAQAMQRQPRLSPATLETLATIAYRQPVGRAEIEEIRGVNSGGVLRTLQERGLIEVVGRGEALGRPLLYGTTALFLETLGLNDLADLPRADELTIALQPHRAEDDSGDDTALASVEEA